MNEHIASGLYGLVRRLPVFDVSFLRAQLPANGVYLFFEKGESVTIGGEALERIVRVGTHRVQGRFPRRLRQHYGRVKTLGGNKNGSVFRKLVGAALMRREDPLDPRLADWEFPQGTSDRNAEELVSIYMRDSFTFVCFQVDDQIERMAIESGLIALLAQHPVGEPSKGWLGYNSGSATVRTMGIWNSQRVNAAPLTVEQLERLGQVAWYQGT